MNIGKMRWWHIDEIMLIEADLFGAEQWTVGMFWNELASGHRYIVATEDNEIRGYAGLAIADEAWVNNIAVRRDAQRRGIGRALLAELLKMAEDRPVLLEVAADNVAAQKMYAMHGFEVIGVRRGYYQPSNTDAYVMRLG